MTTSYPHGLTCLEGAPHDLSQRIPNLPLALKERRPASQAEPALGFPTCSLAPHPLKALLLTRRGEEIRVVVFSLMQRVMGVRSQKGGCGHEGVAIV